jgi:hypothetical protein
MQLNIKNVMGYEGLYLIDSIGNVVSCPRVQGSRFVNQYKILGTKVNRLGYKEVALSRDGKTKTVLLHRLLATHFIDNPDGLPCVNHKNGIKTDNRLENLEWCTRSYNTKHAFDNNLGRFRESAMKSLDIANRELKYVYVRLLADDGTEYEFEGAKQAAEFLGTKSDEVTRAIRKGQRVKGHKAYGMKLADLS